MKNNKIILILIGIIIVSMNFSCKQDEFFEKTNPAEDPWLTVEEFERAAIGIYNCYFQQGFNFASKGHWETAFANIRVLKDASSDLHQVAPTSFSSWPFNEWYNRVVSTPTKNEHSFSILYRAIGNCNTVIDFVNEKNGRPYTNASEVDIEKNVNRIIGETYFLRAWGYFQLVTIFGKVYDSNGSNNDAYIPLRTSLPKNYEEAQDGKLGTTEQIFNLIIEDLKKAKELLPEQYDGDMHPSYQYGRANKFAASAMLAKIYFMMGNNTDALTELNYVIEQNGGQYDLSEEPIVAFSRDNSNYTTPAKEVIWYALYHDIDGFRNCPRPFTVINYGHYSSNTTQRNPCSWNNYALSYAMLKKVGWLQNPDNIYDTLVTEKALNDRRYLQLYFKENGYRGNNTGVLIWMDKYYQGPTNSGDGNCNLADVPIIRLAEMYLTRAYIKAKNNDLAGAIADLDVVRKRAYINFTATDAAISQADLLDLIETERIIELAGEGDRLDYLRSTKQNIPPGDRNISEVSYNDPSLIWVVPPIEIDYNINY